VYYVGWNNQRPPFNSATVRRAFGLAINRQDIIDALLFGQGTPANSTVPPWHPLFPKEAPAPSYDLNAAIQLLERDGWRDTNGDGIREKGGRPLRFTLMTSDRALNRSVVEVLQSQLKKVGADAQIRVLEFQTMLAQHKSRDFDAVFTSWVLDNFQMASAPASLFHSRLATVDQSTNRSGVNIPELDRLIDQASAATDENQARGVWRSMTEVLEREQPVTFVYWLNETAAARKTVNNVVMDQRGELVNIARWTLGRR
jgi:peptide/nickel transport system substrate-binding protein